MEKIIDISKSRINYIHFLSNEDGEKMFGKRWSYSFVYSLIELRDIFIAIQKYGLEDGIPVFTTSFVIGKIPYIKSPWDSRRVLEVVNALKNFGLINIATNKCSGNVFDPCLPGTSLSEKDKIVFRNIFFGYFRFVELASLFINPRLDKMKRLYLNEDIFINESTPLYSFISKRGYVDTYFNQLCNNPNLYVIPEFNDCGDNNSGLKRFWDVFISWGQQLNIIERFNMRNANLRLSNERTFSCSYFISHQENDIDMLNFITNKYWGETCIDIADLILNLCLEYRITLESAQNKVLSYYRKNRDNVSLIRTSEIFIKEREFSKNDKILYPKYQDSFVSHLKLRK